MKIYRFVNGINGEHGTLFRPTYQDAVTDLADWLIDQAAKGEIITDLNYLGIEEYQVIAADEPIFQLKDLEN